MAQEKKLPPELTAAVSAGLHQAPWKDVKAQALILFPVPPGKGNQTFPRSTNWSNARVT